MRFREVRTLLAVLINTRNYLSPLLLKMPLFNYIDTDGVIGLKLTIRTEQIVVFPSMFNY